MISYHDPKLRILLCRHEDIYASGERWNYSNVSAAYWRLYWNDKPGAMIRFGRRRIALKPSVMALVAPHTIFSTCNQNHIGQLYLHFQTMTPHASMKPQVNTFPVTSQLRGLACKIIHLLRQHESPSWQLSLLTRALAELALVNIIDDTLRFPVLDARVQSAITYLEAHLGEDIQNATLARQACISANTLIRLFKVQTGHSPHEYIALKRIEKACLMLHYTDASIKQIAEDTGFCDRYHFSRIFKRCQGTSPAEFRRSNLNPFK